MWRWYKADCEILHPAVQVCLWYPVSYRNSESCFPEQIIILILIPQFFNNLFLILFHLAQVLCHRFQNKTLSACHYQSLVILTPWLFYYFFLAWKYQYDILEIQFSLFLFRYMPCFLISINLCPIGSNRLLWNIHCLPSQFLHFPDSECCRKHKMKSYFEHFVITGFQCLHKHICWPDFTLLLLCFWSNCIHIQAISHYIPLYRLGETAS